MRQLHAQPSSRLAPVCRPLASQSWESFCSRSAVSGWQVPAPLCSRSDSTNKPSSSSAFIPRTPNRNNIQWDKM